MKNIIFLIILFVIFLVPTKSFAKYVITSESVEILKINKADNIKPEINGRNKDVEGEIFQTDVTVNFSDNIGIKSAKYWYNSNEKVFNRKWNKF